MEKIKLNNGQEIENASISEAAWVKGKIFVSLPGQEIVKYTNQFGNPENTKVMESYYSIYKKVFSGYIEIDSISVNAESDRTEIWMKGTETEIKTEYTVPKEYVPGSLDQTTEREEVAKNESEQNDSTGKA